MFGARAWLESKNKGVEEGGRGEALQNICPELVFTKTRKIFASELDFAKRA